MARKRPAPIEDPPAASSSEEEEASDGEEEEEEEQASSSEEEEEEEETGGKSEKHPSHQVQTQASKPVAKKPGSATEQPDSDAETESGSDSEDGRPNNVPPASAKPIASKPMEETPTKRARSKPSATSKSTLAKKTGQTEKEPKDSKRAKKKEVEVDGVATKSEDTKKQLFQRRFSEDDEIAVLKGIIEFTGNKGIDPSEDMAEFYEFVKKSLNCDVSLAQLKDKVSRLKKKFENIVKRSKTGEDKTFSKPNDQKAFDLSKKIWGSEGTSGGGVESSAKYNGKAMRSSTSNNGLNQRGNSKNLAMLKAELGMGSMKEKIGEDDKMEFEVETDAGAKRTLKFDESVGIAGMEGYVIKRGLHFADSVKKAELQEKWKKLHMAEVELFLKRIDLIKEHAQLMLAGYKTEED